MKLKCSCTLEQVSLLQLDQLPDEHIQLKFAKRESLDSYLFKTDIPYKNVMVP